jgi:hypothetical protein
VIRIRLSAIAAVILAISTSGYPVYMISRGSQYTSERDSSQAWESTL